MTADGLRAQLANTRKYLTRSEERLTHHQAAVRDELDRRTALRAKERELEAQLADETQEPTP